MKQASTWTITAARRRFNDGEYALTLVDATGHEVEAYIELLDRARSVEVWDPQVFVDSCDDASACEWLLAAEHERFVADCCVYGVARTYAQVEPVRYGRAMALLRGELAREVVL